MNIQANGIFINDSGPVTPLKLERFADFINAYKANGVDTIVLQASVPVDPQSGFIRDQFLTPNLYGKSAVTPAYMAAFTDLAMGLGVDVIWKPQFIVDNGLDQNVNDYSLGATFYPTGNSFSVETFLANAKTFWKNWSVVAEQHHVSMLVLGTEQGHFAYPPYGAAWREIIQAARENFSGKLTYAENHFAPLPGEGRVDFWDALDYIGIDDYSPIGNGTANTPYEEAYSNVFNSSVFNYNTSTRYDVPGVLYNLHLQYNKPVFFTEFAIDSLDGAMNDPAVSQFSKPLNFSEQENYFRAKFDIYHNYDWVEGIGIFDIVNESSPSPSSSGWPTFFANGINKSMEWLTKPAAAVIAHYWREGALPPPIHASSATKPGGGFAGTASLPDTLVGGFQNDRFDKLGGTYRIYGDDGFDIATYSGSSSNFVITLGSDATTIIDTTGAEGSGVLRGVEALVFSDKSLPGFAGLVLPNQPVASLVIEAEAWSEGNAGTSLLLFSVTLDNVPLSTQTVSWAVTGRGISPVVGADFAFGVLPSGAVDFAPGETSRTISVGVTADAAIELDEGFAVSLTSVSAGLTIGTAVAIGTIQNDDYAVAAHRDAYVVLQGNSLVTVSSSGVLFNDQNGASTTLTSAPAHGILQFAGDGTFGYTPTVGFFGVDSFTYRASNGGSFGDGQALLYVVPVQVGTSTTFNLLALDAKQQIAATYVAFFGRGADVAGLDFWVGEFNRGLPTQGPAALFSNIASSFGISVEAKALYPFLANPFNTSDGDTRAFLDKVYDHLFNRSTDAGGLAYWTDQIKQTLQAGQFVGSVLINIMSGAQDTAAGKDITTLMGKVAVSLAYVGEQHEHETPWLPGDDAAAKGLLDPVTADPASVLIGVRNAEELIEAHA